MANLIRSLYIDNISIFTIDGAYIKRASVYVYLLYSSSFILVLEWYGRYLEA